MPAICRQLGLRALFCTKSPRGLAICRAEGATEPRKPGYVLKGTARELLEVVHDLGGL